MIVIIVIVCAVTVLLAVLLALVVTGMRREPPTSELSTTAPSFTAAIVRRALGVSVRKPDTGEQARVTCFSGQVSSGWMEGRDQ